MSNGKMIPRIRFENFRDNWKKYQLKNEFGILKNYSYSRNDEGRGNYHHIHYGDIHTNYNSYITKTTDIPTVKDKSEHVKLEYKDIVIADASEDYEDLGKAVLISEKDNRNIIAGLHTFALRPFEDISPFYFINYTNTTFYKKFMQRHGTGVSVFGINKANLNKLPIVAPSLTEQQKIGNLFEKLDQAISLQQQVLEVAKEYKQSMLQKMFPKKGEKVPEIRFKGFNEEWKQIYLEKVTDITTGKLDANAMVVNGKYDFYTSGIQKYKINDYAFEGPAITIAGNGATVGYMHIADGLFNAYQRTYVLNNFKANRSYLFYEIKNRLPQKIHEESRAGNIPYIVMDMLTKLVINIPSKEEQQKIGSFFKTLDEKIEQEEKKLEAYESMKKALMQRMFV